MNFKKLFNIASLVSLFSMIALPWFKVELFFMSASVTASKLAFNGSRPIYLIYFALITLYLFMEIKNMPAFKKLKMKTIQWSLSVSVPILLILDIMISRDLEFVSLGFGCYLALISSIVMILNQLKILPDDISKFKK